MYQPKQWFLRMIFLFVIGFVLAACTDHEKPAVSKEEDDIETNETTEEPQDGGTITGAMYSYPTGQFNPIFYEEAYEANILDFTHESLFVQNDKLEFETDLAAEWELNEDQTELTVTLEKGIKWHDGEDLTAEDIVFTYQMIADPDYVSSGGIRTNYVIPLLAYDDYVTGETDDFQGVVAKDDHTVIFKFEDPHVTPKFIASSTIIPKHIFENIPIEEMSHADASQKPGEVIGTGPFKFIEMKEREQYILERNEDYWKGVPYLDKIVWKIIDKSVATGLLEKGDLDFIAEPDGVAPADYEMVNDYEHIHIIEQAELGYQMLGFKHNHRTTKDVEIGEINPDHWVPNEKVPLPVRQAIAYAIDRERLIGTEGEGLLHGKGQLINSPIALQSWAYDENAAIDYSYDPEKAAEILEEAGYMLEDNGFRTDPDGNEWTINMDYPIGNQLRESTVPMIKDFLEDVGIKVHVRDPKEMSSYIEGLTNDDSDWDLYLIGWNLGNGDPDPLGLWGIEDAYNFSRWNNTESQELLDSALKTPEAFEQDYREKVYSEWTNLFSKDLPALLLFAESKLWAHHIDIHGIEPRPHTMYHNSHLWWLEN